ncbi:MAG TPA: hypothetical protein VF658_11795 [Pyrinomonadaceae bacterium]|jgi:hypothetical protein
MFKSLILTFAVLLFVSAAQAQRNAPASEVELKEITERGRMLAEYDVAAWHSTDAVLALKPEEGSFNRYIAKKSGNGWTVVYGRLNEKRDKFLIVYEASQGATPQAFNVKKHDPPKEDSSFYLSAAKAIEIALADFRGENRPYNVAVLPAKSNQMYVYVVPAQTKQGIYPLGGDIRYLISQDGSKIVEKRQLHISIIEFTSPPDSSDAKASFHTAVLDDIPEDTDVFHVLSRTPSVPEWVASKKYVYLIETDGTIKYLMTMEAFKKIPNK